MCLHQKVSITDLTPSSWEREGNREKGIKGGRELRKRGREAGRKGGREEGGKHNQQNSDLSYCLNISPVPVFACSRNCCCNSTEPLVSQPLFAVGATEFGVIWLQVELPKLSVLKFSLACEVL